MKDCGGAVCAVFADSTAPGRGKYAAWRRVMDSLDDIDEIIVTDAGDIPGRTVSDLLKVLRTLDDHGVQMVLHDVAAGIRTTDMLAIIEAFRRAKLSAAIRARQARAAAAGKQSGRPPVPPKVVARIRAALTEGGGIRALARQFNVSPGSVVNIRAALAAKVETR